MPDDRLNSTLAQKHDEVYREAWSLLSGEIEVEGRQPMTHISTQSRDKLSRARELFARVLEIKPDNWAAMWGIGKIFQRFGTHEEALKWFKRAFEIASSNPDVAREVSVCALRLGKADEALAFAEAAAKLKPGDYGLYANWALALLISGRAQEARDKASLAVRGAPHDQTSKRVLEIVERVIAQDTPIPRNLGEVERYLRKAR